jgi:long-subunit fatty acid transport protein
MTPKRPPVNSTSAARHPPLLSLPLYAAAVLAAGLPLRASAIDGPAFSGLIASANDAVTAATNPAGLTRLHKAEWVGGIRAFYSSSDFTTTAQSVGGSLTNSSSGSLVIPSLYYARPFNDDITLGASLTVPSGFGSNPGDTTPGRYLLEQWSLGYASLTPAVGYRVNERLSFGGGVNREAAERTSRWPARRLAAAFAGSLLAESDRLLVVDRAPSPCS